MVYRVYLLHQNRLNTKVIHRQYQIKLSISIVIKKANILKHEMTKRIMPRLNQRTPQNVNKVDDGR